MGMVESNQWCANFVGWTPAELGCAAIDASLVAAIKDTQARVDEARRTWLRDLVDQLRVVLSS